MAGMGNKLANSFLEYHVPSDWLKPSHLEPRDYRETYIKVIAGTSEHSRTVATNGSLLILGGS